IALEQGGADSWDNTGDGAFETGDFAGVVGYGRRMSDDVGVGADIKFLSSSLGEYGASSYAVDLGVLYSVNDRASVGAAVRNLGPGLTFESDTDPLPVTMAVGGSYLWHGVLLSMDLEKVNDLGATTRIGAEYAPVRYLALRGGWIGGDETALSGLTGGVGLNWNERWAVDYAYRASDLGGTHQFALSAGFGGGSSGVVAPASVTNEEDIPVSVVPKANLTVISELAGEVMEEAVGKMGLPEGSRLHLRQVDTHDANWLVKSILLEELTSRGHAVRAGQMTASQDPEDAGVYEIAYRIVYCQTSLPRSWREWVVGARRFERRTAVDIRFELSDRTKTIVWAGGVERERREIIPGGRLDELVAPGQAFASPEVDRSGWDKIFEPVIVAGIVGGLIYLFYTSRSTD
ncbi:MAG: PorV/PorQ family protein, partial [Candidatus Eisenbacteria bacterium]|nr:PorV/PorQ family protein [Candidatus Eisenbacteria bacterium]